MRRRGAESLPAGNRHARLLSGVALVALVPGLAEAQGPATPPGVQGAQQTATPSPGPVGAVATAAAAATGGGSAMATLLAQGRHWQAQNRPDLALQAYERVLAAVPTNDEALTGAAQAQAALGNRAAADALIGRLRRNLSPGDPRLTDAEARVRGESIDRDILAEARRLAREGRRAEAVQRYRDAFGGPSAPPPDSLAAEFYLVLGGSEQGWQAARDGLARLAAQRPGNARIQLALAQLLTYREATRSEGIAMLRRLANEPAVGADAAAAWRQALLWLGTGRSAVPELEAFAARYSGDAAIAQRLAEALAAPAQTGASPGDLARLRGFEQLNASRDAEAARLFEAALATDPNDADALGGLGIVRLRQGRNAEARTLLDRAIAAAPARRAQWQKALDAAAFPLEVAEARTLLRGGQVEAAEDLLRRALQRDVTDRADAEVLLGDALLRRGDPGAAEARYRAALARRPDFRTAQQGLERALRQQGRLAEADDLARRLRATAAPEGGREGGGRAAGLRAAAARATDPVEAAALLRAAMAAEPNNPWIRLDLARLLAQQGRGAEARALIEEPLARGGAEAAFAAALFAEDQGRLADAAALIEGVPPRLRTPAMVALLARGRAAAEVATAEAAARAAGTAGMAGRGRLLALAARQDPSGALAAATIRAFGRLNDPRGAEEAARVALAANPRLAPSARMMLAGALVEAGQPDGAQALLVPLEAESARLSAEDRRQLAALRIGEAVRASDLANERGDQAAGFERLRPVLARDPTDAAANLALARLYQGARQPEEAVRIADAVLARDPRNVDARVAAVDAAIAARDYRQARSLVEEGRALAPQDPRMLVADARLARAEGDPRRALRALEQAAAMRRAQTGESFVIGAGMPGFAVSSVDNPFLRGAPPGDRVATEIDRDLEAAREEANPRVVAAPLVRGRSGTSGLDKLDELSGTIEGSFAPPAIGGRVTARAMPVVISSGNLATDNATLQQFGTNPLAWPGTGRAPSNTTASGVGLNLAWQREGFAIDAGSTPLGFQVTNVVGGIEVAPRLTDTLRLRVVGERRAVTDSLLSWSGERDSLSGRVWGGVVRTGGRAQMEYSVGRASAYVGGGGAIFTGQGVAENSRFEVGAGVSYALIRRPDEELVAGMDAIYFGYDRNLRFFTLGHGGYFSPQSYTALNLPLDYRSRSGPWTWRLGGTLGYATWTEKSAPLFPNDPGLQAQAVANAQAPAPSPGNPPPQATYAGQSSSGVVGGARADVEYQMTPQLRLGAAFRYDRAANWNEMRSLLYLRYRVDDPMGR